VSALQIGDNTMKFVKYQRTAKRGRGSRRLNRLKVRASKAAYSFLVIGRVTA
jgi:hypothetical protein